MLLRSSTATLKNMLLSLGLCFALAACGHQSATTTPLVAENDPVSLKIAAASEKAAKALDTLAGIEQYKNPLPPMEQFAGAPPQIAQPITVSWTGPAEQIVQTLANKAGYRYKIAGKPSQLPLTVVVEAYEKPLIDILRDIGLQLGNRADVAVDVNTNIVQLRYAAIDGK